MINYLLQIVALVAYAVLLVTWPNRKKKLMTNLGEQVLPLTGVTNRFMVPVLVIAPALILFQ